MSQELRDLAKKVMDKVQEAVNREDAAFKKALEFIREEIKEVLGDSGDDSVGEAQSPNPTVAAPIYPHMGGPQPANATSASAPMRELGGDQSQYEDQLPGNGQPELEEGQEPSASIPNAQAPITAEHVAAIGNYGAAATSGLGVEMAQNPDPEVKPEDSATTIEGDEKPSETPDALIAGGQGSTPDSGEEGDSPSPSEAAIAGGDAGTAVQEQKEAEAGGFAESGPLSADGSKPEEDIPSADGLPTGGNSVESTPLGGKPTDSEDDSDSTDSTESEDLDTADLDASEPASSGGKKKKGRSKK